MSPEYEILNNKKKENNNFENFGKICIGTLISLIVIVFVWILAYKENHPDVTPPPTAFFLDTNDLSKQPPQDFFTTNIPTFSPTKKYFQLAEVLRTQIEIKSGLLKVFNAENNQFANPFTYSSLIKQTINECILNCASNSGCAAFQFRSDTNVCNLFDKGIIPNDIEEVEGLNEVVQSGFIPLENDFNINLKYVDPALCSTSGFSSSMPMSNVYLCERLCQNANGDCVGFVYNNEICYTFDQTLPHAFPNLGSSTYCAVLENIEQKLEEKEIVQFPSYAANFWVVQGDLYYYARDGLKNLIFKNIDSNACFQDCASNTFGFCIGFTASSTSNNCFLNVIDLPNRALIVHEEFEAPDASDYTVLINRGGTQNFEWELANIGGLPIYDDIVETLFDKVKTLTLENCLGYCSFNDIAYIAAYDASDDFCYCYQKSFNVAITNNTVFETGNNSTFVYKRRIERFYINVPFILDFEAPDAGLERVDSITEYCQNLQSFIPENNYDFFGSFFTLSIPQGCYFQTQKTVRVHTVFLENNLLNVAGRTIGAVSERAQNFKNINPDENSYTCRTSRGVVNTFDEVPIGAHSTNLNQCFQVCARHILCRGVETRNFRGLRCGFLFANYADSLGIILGTEASQGRESACFAKVDSLNINAL